MMILSKTSASISLSGFGIGLFAAAMPSSEMTLGGLVTLVGLGLMGTSVDLTLRVPGLPPLRIHRRPGPSPATYGPALIGCLAGGGSSIGGFGMAATMAGLASLAAIAASLKYETATGSPAR